MTSLDPGTTEMVYVSHITDPDNFCVQLERTTDSLDEIMTLMQTYYKENSSSNEPLTPLVLGAPCAALYTDGEWYRARITGLLASGMAEVLFVDFGNTDFVSKDSICALRPDLYATPVQSFKCRMVGIAATQDFWPPQHVAQFEDLVLEKSFTATFTSCNPITDCYSVQLVNESGVNVNHKFGVATGSAVLESTVGSKVKRSVQTHGDLDLQVTVQPSAASQSQPRARGIAHSLGVNVSDGGSVSSIAAVPPIVLKTGEKVDVTVVYVINPSDFWCHMRKFGEQNNRLAEDMTAVYGGMGQGEGLLRSLRPGCVCAALFDADETWYRATVEMVTGRDVTVFFLDYGNTETVSAGNIRELKEEFRTLPAQAIKCGLSGVAPASGRWTEEAAAKFEEMVMDKEYMATVISKEPVGSHIVSLFDPIESSDVASMLVDKQADVKPVAASATKSAAKPSAVGGNLPTYSTLSLRFNSKSQVFVSWVTTPGDFHVQLSSNQSILDSLTDGLQDFYNSSSALPLSSIQPGMMVVAKFSEDNAWYRGTVRSFSGRTADVEFVDFGNSDKVDVDSLRQIDKQFSNIPAQAVRCSLAGVRPLVQGQTWSGDAKDFLERLTENGAACQFVVSLGDRYKVELEVEGKNVSREMIALAVVRGVSEPRGGTEPPGDSGDQYKFEKVGPGQRAKVYVAFAESVVSFYVQLSARMERLDDLMAQMVEFYDGGNARSLRNPQIGILCVTRYEEDGSWYRAQVQAVTPKGVNVFFVDYGNTQLTPKNAVFQLEPPFITLSAQAIHCSLDVMVGPNTDAQLKQFSDVTGDEELELVVKSLAGPKLIVDLLKNGVSLTSQMKGASPAKSPPKSVRPTGGGDYPPPNIMVGQTVQAFASFIESPSRFWIQIAGTDDELEAMMKCVGQQYSSGMEPPLANPIQGQPCCALYIEDESWYRASVVSVHGQQIKVRFVDYGNTELVDRENVKPLSSALLNTPLLSIECCLDGFPSVAATEQALEATENLIAEKKISVTFTGGKNVRVMVDGQDAGQVLQSKGYGGQQQRSMPSPHKSPPAQPAFGSRSPQQAGSGYGTRSPLAAFPGPRSFKDPSPPSGSSDAIITHLEEDSGMFFVQLLSAETQLEQLSTKLQSVFNSGGSPLPGPPTKDMVCGARFSADCFWYRSKVDSVSGGKVKVRFVDYGNTEFAQSSSLKALPPELFTTPVLAFPCQLKGLQSWTKQIAAAFAKVALDVQVKVRFVNTSPPFDVQVTANGQDVLQAVSQSPASSPQKPFGAAAQDRHDPPPARGYGSKQGGPAQPRGFGSAQDGSDSGPAQRKLGSSPNKGFGGSSPLKFGGTSQHGFGGGASQKFGSSPQKPACPQQVYQAQKPPSDNKKVYVSHVCEDGTFYIQLTEESEKIERITEKLESLAMAVHPEPKVGAACAAKFSADEVWYRAIIKSVRGGSVEVMFVDYGNGERCAVNSIKPLTADLLIPLSAYHCQLEETGPLPAEQLKLFKTTTEEKELKATFVAGDPLSVSLSDENGKSLVQTLFPLGSLRSQKIPKETVSSMVSHVDENGLFFLQLNREENDLLALGEKIEASYAGKVEKAESFERGQLCCAKFSEDGAWYRARVLNDCGDSVSVLFVDYGNTEVVTKEDVLKLLPAFTQPAFAYECRLQGAVSWTLDQKKKFVAMTDGKTMNARFLSLKPPYEVELTRSIGLELMDEAATDETAGEETAEDNQVTVTAVGEQAENVEETVSTQKVVSAPTTEAQAAQKQTFPAQMPPTTSLCIVSHVDMQGEFFLQLTDDENRETLSERLQEECESSTASLTSPVTNMVCCAKFSEDEAWYRAVVESVEGETVTVRFVDVGNTDQVHTTDLRPLSAESQSVAPLAYHCVLEGCENARNEVSSNLDELTFDQTLTVTFMSSSLPYSVQLKLEDGSSLITHFSGSKTVSAEETGGNVELADDDAGTRGAAAKSVVNDESHKCVSLKLGHRQKVSICQVVSPSLFYIQLENHAQVDEQADAMFEHYSTLAEGDCLVEKLTVGQLCACQFGEDGSWYRAQVESVDPDSDTCTLFYVDYGNADTVALSSIRHLLPEFESLPWQSVACSLAGVRCTGEEWSEDVKTAFEELVADKSVLADVISGNGKDSPYFVHLLDLGISVTAALLGQDLSGIEAVEVALEPSAKRVFLDTLLSEEEKFEDTVQDVVDGGQSTDHLEKQTVDELGETENEVEFSRQLNQRAAQLESTMLDESPDGTTVTCPDHTDEPSALLAVDAEAEEKGGEGERKAEEDEEDFEDAVEADAINVTDNNSAQVTVQADEDHQAKFNCIGDGLAELEWIAVHVCVTTSPTDFWCQLSSAHDHLASSALGCDNATKLEPVLDYQMGHVYLVCDPPQKNYRAKVLGVDSDSQGLSVLKVDYGVTETVSKDHLFHLSNEQLSVPAQAFACSLDEDFQPRHAWLSGLMAQGRVYDDAFQIKVVGRKADGTLLVDLRTLTGTDTSQTGKDVAETDEKEVQEGERKAVCEISMEIFQPILQSTVLGETFSQSRMDRFDRDKEYSVQLLEEGKEYEVSAAHAGDPSAFYLTLVSNQGVRNALTDDIAAEMAEKSDDQGSAEAPGVGNPCFVKDTAMSRWLRGQVKSISGDTWKVLCVDSGATVDVKKDSLHDLPSRFLDPPAQALSCCLADLVPVDGRWCEDALTFFKDFTSQGPLRAYICSYSPDNSTCQVTLLDPQTQCDMTVDRAGNEPSLNRTLVELGYAEAVPGSALDMEMQLERTINDPDKLEQLESSFTDVSYQRESSLGDIGGEEEAENGETENGLTDEKGDAGKLQPEGQDGITDSNEQDVQDGDC